MGTEAHPITAKRGGKLKFQTQFVAKTTPNSLMSKAGGKYGNQWAVRDSVDHPGNEARNFHTIIAKQIQTDLHEGGNEIMRLWLRQSTRPAIKTNSLL